MNERQRAHIDYFLERIEYWGGTKRDVWAARMLAARDADLAHPLRSEEEGSVVEAITGDHNRGRTHRSSGKSTTYMSMVSVFWANFR
jgi:hypothetical protein